MHVLFTYTYWKIWGRVAYNYDDLQRLGVGRVLIVLLSL